MFLFDMLNINFGRDYSFEESNMDLLEDTVYDSIVSVKLQTSLDMKFFSFADVTYLLIN